MTLSGHQPNYWPYPGLIGKIMKSDRFIYVTKVQYEKKSWQKRNRIRTKDGWSYIQVPTITKGKFEQKICEVAINNRDNWEEKTLRSISLAYGKAPYYQKYKEFLEDLYHRKWELLWELDIYIMNFILQELEIDTEICYDRDFTFQGKKTEMLVDMCRQLGCDTYLSNLGSAAYVEISEFTKEGFNHRYMDYKGQPYRQQYPGFEPGLSILDMLMNCGKEGTREILMSQENYELSETNEELIREGLR